MKTVEVHLPEPSQPSTSPDGSRPVVALLLVLSIVAGSTDVIGYLVLDGLFTSHITGNLVLLAARLDGGQAQVSKMLAIPVYLSAVGLTTLLSDLLRSRGLAPLRFLLLLQFLLLAGFLGVCVASGPRIDPHAANAILAGMLGVSAMAVQNALVQISFEGMPPTAVMTGNVTRFAIHVIEAGRGGDPARLVKTLHRAARTLSMILGFASGCALGAACEAAVGMWSLALPAALALLALAMAIQQRLGAPQQSMESLSLHMHSRSAGSQ